jgi:ferredoxin
LTINKVYRFFGDGPSATAERVHRKARNRRHVRSTRSEARQGVELAYSCTGDVCSTCRATLLEGEVDMDADFALEDDEIARGFVLDCQSYLVSCA